MRFPDDVIAETKKQAKLERRSTNAVIVQALIYYLNHRPESAIEMHVSPSSEDVAS